MKTWSLETFIQDFGIDEAVRVMGYSTYRSLYQAKGRNITIELADGVYTAKEDKKINTSPETK